MRNRFLLPALVFCTLVGALTGSVVEACALATQQPISQKSCHTVTAMPVSGVTELEKFSQGGALYFVPEDMNANAENVSIMYCVPVYAVVSSN